jgi:hypothetical protein
MFIDSTYFYGPLMIAEWEKTEVQTNIQQFIDKYEPELLDLLLGYKLFKAFKAGLQELVVPTKWTNLLYGCEYTTRFGNLDKWEGFVTYTDGLSIGTYFPDDIQFTVDGGGLLDPVSGQNQYRNTFLANLQASYRIVERGTGPLKLTEATKQSVGGFDKAVNFTPGGVYTIEFIKPIPLPAPASVVVSTNKQSLIANWVYYWYTRDAQTQTTGTGEKVSEAKNSTNVTAITKGMRAYNEMVNKNMSLKEFLLSNDADYPEYYLNSGDPMPYYKKDSITSLFKHINVLNL